MIFFNDNMLTYQSSHLDHFELFTSERLQILHGDYFKTDSSDLQNISAVYDRGSLVAFPPNQQLHYVDHLSKVIPSRTKILLVSFDYPLNEIKGPPFSIDQKRVHELFSSHFNIELLEECDGFEHSPALKNRGLSRLTESVYLLTKKWVQI